MIRDALCAKHLALGGAGMLNTSQTTIVVAGHFENPKPKPRDVLMCALTGCMISDWTGTTTRSTVSPFCRQNRTSGSCLVDPGPSFSGRVPLVGGSKKATTTPRVPLVRPCSQLYQLYQFTASVYTPFATLYGVWHLHLQENTGDRNTGDRNTGDRNTGDRN